MKNRFSVIGFGNRIYNVFEELVKLDPDCSVAAVLDNNPDAVKERLTKCGFDADSIPIFSSDEIDAFFDIECDGMFVGSNCNTHTMYAKEVIKRKIPLFLEKPVCINEEQLAELQSLKPASPVVVSFPLRVTPIYKKAKELIDSGAIGDIMQIQAVNNVYYGRGYYKKWYRDDSITNGLFLQKATHDIDCILHLLGDQLPTSVAAMESKTYYKGDKPVGLKCSQCKEYYTCPESTWFLKHIANEPDQPENCSFAVDTGNHDSASVMMMFANGIHAVYTQNFIVRKSAGARSMRIIGSKGSIEFSYGDAYLKMVDYVSGHVTEVKQTDSDGHYGGDKQLLLEFSNLINYPSDNMGFLDSGIKSAQVCLAAKKSAETLQFIKF